jgi:bacteriocin-type transport-associated protein
MRKGLYILGKFNDSDIEWLIHSGKRVAIPANTVLIEEGRPIDAFYIVLEGNFSVSISSTQSGEVGRAGAGDVLGEVSFIDSRPPMATVTAAEPSLVLSIARAVLQEKLRSDTGFASRFYHAVAAFLADRLRSDTSRIAYDEKEPLRADVEYEDELDTSFLDTVSKAGSHFEAILRSLRGGR